MSLALHAEHAGRGELTYVHCKAGRGRSTTLVLCYLIKQAGMTPEEAFAYVRSRRPQVLSNAYFTAANLKWSCSHDRLLQVLLANNQWQSVCMFYGSCHGLPEADAARPHPDAAATAESALECEAAAGAVGMVCASPSRPP